MVTRSPIAGGERERSDDVRAGDESGGVRDQRNIDT